MRRFSFILRKKTAMKKKKKKKKMKEQANKEEKVQEDEEESEDDNDFSALLEAPSGLLSALNLMRRVTISQSQGVVKGVVIIWTASQQ